MCGIVGYTGSKNTTEVLLSGLHKLEYRGYDSAGIAVLQNGKIRIVKAKGRLSQLEEKLAAEGSPLGSCGIGHTRWATHGEPSDVNSHPHGNEHIAIVHNGIIENYQELRTFLTKRGYVFESQTDTESIVKLLDYCYHGDPEAAIRQTVSQLRGSYALAMVFRDFPDRIFAIRKDSPLIIGLGKNENFVASDIPAILKHTADYLLPDENELCVVTAQNVTVTNWVGDPVEKPVLHAEWSMEDAEKGGFPHFMLKEIHEEPQALRDTIQPRVTDGLPQLESIDDSVLSQVKRLHIVACGTAMHAGMVGKTAIEALARIPAEVSVASEFRYCDPIFAPGDLAVFITQSGETADTLAALRLAKSRHVPTLAIVNVLGSSIAREADYVLYTHAGPEIAVASTKAYTVQVALLLLFAVRLGLASGHLEECRARLLTAALLESPALIEETLQNAEEVKKLAAQFQNAHDLFFIGRALDYALSLEGSLKLKEISYIHSEAYAAGELKHGTISLVTTGTPVIALMTQPKLAEKMVSNIREVTTRGAEALLICGANVPVPEGLAAHTLMLPPCEPLLAPLASAVLLQLFAYYTAVLRGCDVDRPRNLAKSVTVE